MGHPFLMKEIALQAGLGLATVDRVLNGRAHVREQTRRRVQQAINDLEKQQRQLPMSGKRLVVDVVIETPRRFADEIQNALETVIPGLPAAILRPRFLMREAMTAAEVVDALRAIARRGSHGVFIKAQEAPEISIEVDNLMQRGIPVVTVFTDLPLSRRLAYTGLDNRMGGATAAWLIGQWLGRRGGSVFVAMTNELFCGEKECELSFRQTLSCRSPHLLLIDAGGAHGPVLTTEERVREAVDSGHKIAAVFSMGGGNAALLRALKAHRQKPKCFIAHDLDQEAIELLRNGSITAVLPHDLRGKMQSACEHMLSYHKLLPPQAISPPSPVAILTPTNIPQKLAMVSPISSRIERCGVTPSSTDQ